MTPGAQIAASIEVLENVNAAWRQGRSAPVDAMLGDYFRQRRFIGAKDKGFISRRIYAVLRHGASLQWWVEKFDLPVCPRSLVLATLALEEKHDLETLYHYFSGTQYDPTPLTEEEKQFVRKAAGHNDSAMPEWMRLNVPQWCSPSLEQRFGEDMAAELMALNAEAPLDLRVNTLKASREEAELQLKAEGFSCKPTPHSSLGLRVGKRGAIFTTHAFKNGLIEVQDEGSQIAALLADAKPGQKVIDFCAGAGGKTLALAAQMQNKGRILAWDTSAIRLEQMQKRLKRAGVDNVQRHVLESEQDAFIKRHKHSADIVLIDAPCSGSGTWRRNPDLKWRFNPQDLAETISIQRRILESAQRLVKPEGKLIYVTCSLFPEENEQQIDHFLTTHSDFCVASPAEIWNKSCGDLGQKMQDFLILTPRQHGTDGFFAAILRKN